MRTYTDTILVRVCWLVASDGSATVATVVPRVLI